MKLINRIHLFNAIVSAGKGVKSFIPAPSEREDESAIKNCILYEAVEVFADIIDRVNILDPYETMLDGYPLTEVYIPAGLSSLILPSAVRLSLDSELYPNLKDVDDGWIHQVERQTKRYDPITYQKALNLLREYYKGANIPTVSISSIVGRTPVTLESVMDKAQFIFINEINNLVSDDNGFTSLVVDKAICVPIKADAIVLLPLRRFSNPVTEVEELFFRDNLVKDMTL
jgi:hypothetical protein